MKNKTALFKLFRKDLGERREETWERKIKNRKGSIAWDKLIIGILVFLVVLIVIYAVYKAGFLDFLKDLIPDFKGEE